MGVYMKARLQSRSQALPVNAVSVALPREQEAEPENEKPGGFHCLLCTKEHGRLYEDVGWVERSVTHHPSYNGGLRYRFTHPAFHVSL